MPNNVTFEQACCFPVVGLTAYCGLVQYGRLRRGERVLVVGASGGVGSQAVPMAKLLGASFVGAVCSAKNVAFAKNIGADKVYDYQSTSIEEMVKDCKPDLILDTIGVVSVFLLSSSLLIFASLERMNIGMLLVNMFLRELVVWYVLYLLEGLPISML